MAAQGITVEYENKQMYCMSCDQHDVSDGKMAYLNDCKHTYHISCLIDYASANNICHCPQCKVDIQDIRLSLAIAYNQQDTQKFINALL